MSLGCGNRRWKTNIAKAHLLYAKYHTSCQKYSEKQDEWIFYHCWAYFCEFIVAISIEMKLKSISIAGVKWKLSISFPHNVPHHYHARLVGTRVYECMHWLGGQEEMTEQGPRAMCTFSGKEILFQRLLSWRCKRAVEILTCTRATCMETVMRAALRTMKTKLMNPSTSL